jgi:plasmid stability protein
MRYTCNHADHMAKMIQVRNVPDQLYRTLKIRAVEQGISLSAYIVLELRRLAERVPPQELAERARIIVREDFKPSPADLLRAERNRRSS